MIAERRGLGPQDRSRRLKKRLVLQCNIAAEVKKSTQGSTRLDLPRLNMEARGVVDTLEKRRFGGRHPHLSAALQPVEQRRAPLGIEMGRNLVEQQDRRLAAAVSHQLGVGENEAEQQRF